MSGTPKFPLAMQTEKRDFLLHFATRGKSLDGTFRGNEQCQIQAMRSITGFQSEWPKIHQQSYPERMIAWNFQNDVVEYIQPLVYAATGFGNNIITRSHFEMKYPRQVNDWAKELR